MSALPGPREFDAPRGERTARDGLLVVDKPQGWTSHDVVARVRRMAATKKVGHAGTLDPMATGVLVLGIGRATKLLTWVVGETKTYRAVVRLGADTVTDDAEGDLTRAPGAGGVDRAAIESALPAFRGEISQVPSSVSAIKVDGQRSYARVRAGEEVALEARDVTVSRFEITGEPVAAQIALEGGGAASVLDVPVVVDCSSGTYIRALARDLGVALGTGGHLTALRREAVGQYGLDGSATLDALAATVRESGELPVLGLTQACRALFDVRALDEAQTAAVRVGKFLPPTGRGSVEVSGGSAHPAGADRPVAALAPSGEVAALVVDKGGAARPVLVFAP